MALSKDTQSMTREQFAEIVEQQMDRFERREAELRDVERRERLTKLVYPHHDTMSSSIGAGK
ncbi:MAG: hypothetical protein JWQ94_2008 [Tardiphaga sp.]|jgi:hypothetical protein|nr:hypothetical protein [Tardiphaga sp.]